MKEEKTMPLLASRETIINMDEFIHIAFKCLLEMLARTVLNYCMVFLLF